MFLEPLEKYHALPRVLTANDSLFREQARANWARFVKRLRKPRRLDDRFFLIVEIDSQIIYLDQVSWFDSKIAGRDALKQVYRSFPEEYARENVIDFGYLENGLVKESHWLTAVYLPWRLSFSWQQMQRLVIETACGCQRVLYPTKFTFLLGSPINY